MSNLRSFIIVISALVLAAMPFAASSQQAPTFRVRAESVVLYVTVTDSSRRLVPNLVEADFEVFDNDRPQEITVFENQVQPISVVVMLDRSASMTANLDLLDAASEQFLLRLLPDDRGRVGGFSDKIEVHPAGFTEDRDELINVLDELDFGNPTRLYDAVEASIAELEAVDGRRVVLVFTDGDDTSSKIGLGDVLDRAREQEVMVYAIGLESDYFNGVRRVRTRPDRGLRRLAQETGGGYFELQETDDLGPTFTRVAQELHSQYMIGFTPQVLDGKVHSLEVNVTQRGMNARARRSYVAPRSPSPSSD